MYLGQGDHLAIQFQTILKGPQRSHPTPKHYILQHPRFFSRTQVLKQVGHDPMWSRLTKCGVMKKRDKGKSLTIELKCVMHVRGFRRRALELHGASLDSELRMRFAPCLPLYRIPPTNAARNPSA